MSTPLLRVTTAGLYCEEGDFFIDPWQPAHRAIITHAHGDHARPGSRQYLTSRPGVGLLRARVGSDADIETVEYGETFESKGVRVSLHPAGHVLGSAQVRIERGGEVWVVSGDYKLTPDPTCAPFEPIRCHTFITESTFGLPIFRWPETARVFEEIHAWWRANQAEGKASVVFAYALGKAQRILAGLESSIGPVFTHGAVDVLNAAYRESGVVLGEATHAGAADPKTDWSRALIVGPPSAQNSPWMRRFGDVSTAFVSGWMTIRGMRRRRSVDRGFVLSDHADWPGLLSAVDATGAERVLVTHGYVAPLVRWLREQGLEAHGLQTQYEGERDEAGAVEPGSRASKEVEPQMDTDEHR